MWKCEIVPGDPRIASETEMAIVTNDDGARIYCETIGQAYKLAAEQNSSSSKNGIAKAWRKLWDIPQPPK